MDQKNEKYFLAANSCDGFISHFADSYCAVDGWRAFLIKGGPGTGKSSLMRYMANRGAEKGETVILCPCSSDPHSLDGVLFPKKRIAFLDATAPHVVEPQMPGVCEQLIDLGAYWDADRLFCNRESIAETMLGNKTFHRRAARYLSAAGEVLRDNLSQATAVTDTARCAEFARRAVKNLIPDRHAVIGSEWIRFLNGVTPEGVLDFSDSVAPHYQNRVIVEDRFGSVSTVFMEIAREYALAAGYEIITVKSALLPERLTEHILIPELSLGFFTENEFVRLDGTERRIHARRFQNVAALHTRRERMNFNRRLSRELIDGACRNLAAAKAVHDRLEKFYVDAMDFSAATAAAQKLADRLFGT